MTSDTPASTDTGHQNDVKPTQSAYLRTGVPDVVFTLDRGAAAAIFGIRIGLVPLIPGPIFELARSAKPLTKGFSPATYGGPPATPRPS